MRILVIGGTRFIGRAVVGKLLAGGHQLALFNRGRTRQEPPPGCVLWRGERRNLTGFREHLQQFAPDRVLDMVPFCEQDASELVSFLDDLSTRLVAMFPRTRKGVSVLAVTSNPHLPNGSGSAALFLVGATVSILGKAAAEGLVKGLPTGISSISR